MHAEDILDQETTAELENFSYPLEFEFKITTLSNDFFARDAQGRTLAYVRQKMFKFKEAVMVYSNDDKQKLIYKIDADRIIDFNANYQFTDHNEEVVGRIGRKGMRSIWKANYQIFNKQSEQDYFIQEENPWAKVGDALLGEIPILNFFTGYLANPRYAVKTMDGRQVARLSKTPSFFGRRFKLEQLEDFSKEHGERILLSLMMMVLLERKRG